MENQAMFLTPPSRRKGWTMGVAFAVEPLSLLKIEILPASRRYCLHLAVRCVRCSQSSCWSCFTHDYAHNSCAHQRKSLVSTWGGGGGGCDVFVWIWNWSAVHLCLNFMGGLCTALHCGNCHVMASSQGKLTQMYVDTLWITSSALWTRRRVLKWTEMFIITPVQCVAAGDFLGCHFLQCFL